MYNDTKVYVTVYATNGTISIGAVNEDLNQAISALIFEGYEPIGFKLGIPESFRLKSGELGWAAIHERTLITKA